MHSYVIHLERSTERLPMIDALRERLGSVQVITAVDGVLLTQNEIGQNYQRSLHKPRFPFELSRSEIACFLSHRKAWEEVVNSKDDFALIFEDDVVLSDAFDDALATALRFRSPDLHMRFPVRGNEEKLHLLSETPPLFIPKVIGLSAACYALGWRSAERLLELTQNFDRPVDTFLQMRWLTNLDTLSVFPSGVTGQSSVTKNSTIQKKKSISDELKRIVPREVYKFHMKRLSAK